MGMRRGRSLSSRPKYVKYAECTPGETIVAGKFIKEVEGKYGPQVYIECHKTGEQYCLNKQGQLAFILNENDIGPGDNIEVVYKGQEILPSGKFAGRQAHQFDVFDLEDGSEGWGDDEDEDGIHDDTEENDDIEEDEDLL